MLFRTLLLAALIPVCRGGDEPAPPRPEVKALLSQIGGYPDEAAINEWKKEVATRPGIKPDLFELLRLASEVDKSPEAVGRPLFALQQRKDLTAEELSKVVRPLEGYRSAAALDPLQLAFAYGGLLVLKNYPSAEHEDLAIAYLSRPEFLARQSAAETLAEIGTAKSLPPLLKLAADSKPQEGLRDHNHDAARQAIAAIERRVPGPLRGEPAGPAPDSSD